MNLVSIYKVLGNLEQALASTLKSLELKPDNPDSYLCLSEIFFKGSKYIESAKAIETAITLKCPQNRACQMMKAACLFELNNYDEATKILGALKSKDVIDLKSLEIEAALKATVHANSICNPRSISGDKSMVPDNRKENKDLVITAHRPVGEKLLNELSDITCQKLSATKDGRFGNGYCTDFNLFGRQSPEIQRLSYDLEEIISQNISKRPCSFNFGSFLNIFNSGAGQPPHTHLKDRDFRFNLMRHKYSLVYYLDPGDQQCEHPGILRLHSPEFQIMPERGLIVIIPATREHSVIYGGSKPRLMIGVNFYAF